ncbi:DUF6985 domain-containing protein [Priestia megaterium]|uniref:DUF6985 domain-containing protein n=1 Tax=Priestia megaterium TaxID=1404 RepID=UPI00048EC7C1|nr:DUF2004 domain-containing protein [Priestia megaterium]RCX25030.1 uncharacterized protein DUF2004 [Bacillus sp. AG236]TCN11103.1 uncharacterized protein DUF2004 [Bacillus sp. BK006]MCP1446941.1 hypothetical protein [Priestia megaterium]MDC7721607.1 DUF2004 domain-containing protein [Priestia megaterium]MED4051517.1 DUF2004 domain-containing protein [Priestia megaterium]
MKINDAVFGELEYDLLWSKDTSIVFLGHEVEIALMVKGAEDGKFDKEQYAAYTSLMQNWEQLQQSLLPSILDYYKQERQDLGYDIEVNENYPLVETTNEISEMIRLDGIVVPYVGSFDGRDIGLTFNCTWDIENRLGIRLLNEKVAEVGYQDVAI